MTITMNAVFDGEVFRPDEPLDLPPNTKVRLTIDCLVERIGLAPSRQWIEEYLNLIKELIDFCELTSDDPRLALTLPKKETRLPVNINQRYVLNAQLATGEYPIIGLILGADFTRYHRLHKEAYQFKPRRGELVEEAPYWISKQDGLPSEHIFADLKNEWRKTVLAELARGKRSGFRKHHEPLIYEAATDLDCRESLLDRAFPLK